jgi:hypothetical protein
MKCSSRPGLANPTSAMMKGMPMMMKKIQSNVLLPAAELSAKLALKAAGARSIDAAKTTIRSRIVFSPTLKVAIGHASSHANSRHRHRPGPIARQSSVDLAPMKTEGLISEEALSDPHHKQGNSKSIQSFVLSALRGIRPLRGSGLPRNPRIRECATRSGPELSQHASTPLPSRQRPLARIIIMSPKMSEHKRMKNDEAQPST